MCCGSVMHTLGMRDSQMGYFVFNSETFMTMLPRLSMFRFCVHLCLQNKRLNALAILFHITAA